MMDALPVTQIAQAAAIGTGMMTGLFFAFSTFVMQALGRLAPDAGIAAMQQINRRILNPLFFVVFFGPAALSTVLLVWAALNPGAPGAAGYAIGAAAYLAGCIVVTLAFNVPLNNRLDRADGALPESREVWRHYRRVWMRWNHLRGLACLLATVLLITAGV